MSMTKWFGRKLMALHHDEQGANMVEYILLIAAVALPVLAVVLLYRNEISDWIKSNWEEVRGTPDITKP